MQVSSPQLSLKQPETRSALSSARSSVSTVPNCPLVYEKMIIELEADGRRHICIEQQLKLDIEIMEARIEDL